MLAHFGTSIAHAGVISDAKPLTTGLLDLLNFLLSIAGIIAIIGLVIAGVIYVTAGGDRDRIRIAKKSFGTAVVGIVIVLAAWILVSQLSDFFS